MKNLLWMLFIFDTFGLPVKAAIPTITDTKADIGTSTKVAVTTVPDTEADVTKNTKAAVTTEPDTKAATAILANTQAASSKETERNNADTKASGPASEHSTFAHIFNDKLFEDKEDPKADDVIEADIKTTTTTVSGTKATADTVADNKTAGNIVADPKAEFNTEANTKAAGTTVGDRTVAGNKMDDRSSGMSDEIFDDKAVTKADGIIELDTEATTNTIPDTEAAVNTEGGTKVATSAVADTTIEATKAIDTQIADTTLEDTKAAANTVADTNAAFTTLEESTGTVAHTFDDEVFDDKEETKATAMTVSDTEATGTTLQDSTVGDIDAEDTSDGEITIWPREVFCTDDASLFRISADQSVSSPVEGRLQIFRFQDDKMLLEMHPHLKYPIIPSISPVLLSENKQVVMLPDLDVKGDFIGVELPEDTINIFFKLIHDPPHKYLEDVVVIKADTIAAKLLHKAETWRGAMDKRAEAILQAGPPAPPGHHPILRKSAQYARTASQKVMQVTKFTAGMVGHAVEKLGETVRHENTNPEDMGVYEEITSNESISNSEHSSSSNLFKRPKKKESNIDKAVVEVLATTHVNQAWERITEALQKASEILINSLKENTVKVARHKYGEDVGEAVKDLITSAKNTNEVRKHLREMRLDKITGRTFKRVFIGPPEENKPKKPPPPGQCSDEL